MFLKKIPTSLYFFALAAASAGISFIGIFLQAFFQLNPCPYCIFQRLLYFIIAAMALLACLPIRLVQKVLSVLMALICLGGCALATYQSVMQRFPGVLPECGFSEPNAIERLVDFLGARFPDWFLATGFCSSVEWSMFGLSMANWSALCFLAMGVYCLVLLIKR